MNPSKESLIYGLKKVKEAWWWILPASLYIPIGGFIFWFLGFTIAKWLYNPDILEKLNFSTFRTLLWENPFSMGNYKTFASVLATTFLMYLILYFFTGYLPSKKAANKNHSRLMLNVTVWYFVLYILLALICNALIKLNIHGKNIILNFALNELFKNICRTTFGAIGYITIAFISYMREDFSIKHVFYAVLILIGVEILKVLTISLPTAMSTYGTNGPNTNTLFLKSGFVETFIAWLLTIFGFFEISTTLLYKNFFEGIKKGFLLIKNGWQNILAYLLIYTLYIIAVATVRLAAHNNHSKILYHYLIPVILIFIVFFEIASILRLAEIYHKKL